MVIVRMEERHGGNHGDQGLARHVYFAEAEVDRARAVCEGARDLFDIQMGRMHVQPVGPHPTGSCQLTVQQAQFQDVMSWLALNRDGLTVFAHAETGDVMADHTQHVMWLGESRELRIDVLRAAIEKATKA